MLEASGSTSSIGCMIDQIAASVAPPRLTSRSAGSRRQAAGGSDTGIQSPDSSASRSEASSRAGSDCR